MSKLSKKITAAITLFCYLIAGQGLPSAPAAPSGSAPIAPFVLPLPGTSARQLVSAPLVLPSRVGELEEFQPASAVSRLPAILHLQTAHGDFEAQMALVRTLEYLKKNQGLDLLLLEGADEPLEPALDRFFENNTWNQQVADERVKQGRMSGAAYFLMRQPKGSVKAIGVESAEAYRENREDFLELIRERTAFETFLKSAEAELDRLFAKNARSSLLDLRRQEKAFAEGKLDWASWISTLQKTALTDLNLDLEHVSSQKDWPSLLRFLWLRALEPLQENTDQPLQTKDLTDAMKRLVKKSPQGAEDFRYGEVRLILEEWLSSQDPQKTAPPSAALKAAVKKLALQNEIRAEALWRETKALNQKLMNFYAETPAEKELLKLESDLKLLRGLLLTELSFQDYQRTLKRGETLLPSRLMQALQRLSQKKPVVPAAAWTREDRGFHTALKFYSGAKAREKKMAENALKFAGQSRARWVVLVSGGFHSAGLRDEFAARGLAYMRVTPRTGAKKEGFSAVVSQDPRAVYRQAFLDHSAETEDLAQIEDAAVLPISRKALGRLGIDEASFVSNRTSALRQWSRMAVSAKRETAARQFNTSPFARQYNLQWGWAGGEPVFRTRSLEASLKTSAKRRSEVRNAPRFEEPEDELAAAEQIIRHFPAGVLDNFSRTQALLAVLYGGLVQFNSYNPVSGQNAKTQPWRRHEEWFEYGLLALKDSTDDGFFTPEQRSQAERLAQEAEAWLRDEQGIDLNRVIEAKGGPAVPLGDFLTHDPRSQNKFFRSFLEETSDEEPAQSRFERAARLLRLPPSARRYFTHFDHIFVSHIEIGETLPFAVRAQHNNIRGPYKGGIRIIYSSTLQNDEHWMALFNSLKDVLSLGEMKYLLRKYVMEETKPLAFGMTSKAAVAGLPFGGGKGTLLAADIVQNPDGSLAIKNNFEPEHQQIYIHTAIRAMVHDLAESGTVSENDDIPAADLNSASYMAIMADEHVKTVLRRLIDRSNWLEVNKVRLHKRLTSLEKHPHIFNFLRIFASVFVFFAALFQMLSFFPALEFWLNTSYSGRRDLQFLEDLESLPQNTPEALMQPLYLAVVTQYLQDLQGNGRRVPRWARPLTRSVGAYTSKPVNFSGSIFRPEATGYGGIHVAKEVIKLEKDFSGNPERPLDGLSAKLAGMGGVGGPAAEKMIQEGVRLQLISEGPSGGVTKAGGFSLEELKILRRILSETRGLKALNTKPDYRIEGAQYILPQEIEERFLSEDTDLVILAAVENAVHLGNVDRMKGRIFLEMANGGIASEAYDPLIARGGLVVPDTLDNAGGVSVSYFEWVQNLRNESWSKEKVIERLEKTLTRAVRRVDEVRQEFKTDWRTAADILMIRDVLEARAGRVFPLRVVRSEVRSVPIKVLFADNPANKATLEAARRLIEETFGPDVELIAASGMGKNPDELKEVIAKEKPAVILVRSGTTLFKKEPAYLAEAAQMGVRTIIRMGAGTDNINREAAAAAGIAVIRTNGNENSVANLTLRFLIASLGYGTDLQRQPSVPDIHSEEGWESLADVPLEEFLTVLSKSKERGEAWPNHSKAVFQSTSVKRLRMLMRLYLEGKTIGLVGFGPTAQAFAGKLQRLKELTGIHFEVVATSPGLDQNALRRTREADRLGVRYPGEAAVLAQSHVLSFHLPKVTKPWFTAQRFAEASKLTTILNPARQAVIDASIFETFFKREDARYFADVDLVEDGKAVEALNQLRSRFPNQALLIPHIAASTEDAGKGVEQITLPVLLTALRTFLNLPRDDSDTELDIVNGIGLQPLRSEVRVDTDVSAHAGNFRTRRSEVRSANDQVGGFKYLDVVAKGGKVGVYPAADLAAQVTDYLNGDDGTGIFAGSIWMLAEDRESPDYITWQSLVNEKGEKDPERVAAFVREKVQPLAARRSATFEVHRFLYEVNDDQEEILKVLGGKKVGFLLAIFPEKKKGGGGASGGEGRRPWDAPRPSSPQGGFALDFRPPGTFEPVAPFGAEPAHEHDRELVTLQQRSEVRIGAQKLPPEEITAARTEEFFAIRDELLAIFSRYKKAKGLNREADQKKLLAQAHHFAKVLPSFIAEIRSLDETEQRVLDSYGRMGGKTRQSEALQLGQQIRAMTPQFVAQWQIYNRRGVSDMDRRAANTVLNQLNAEVVKLAKRRLKLQLLQFKTALETDPLHQGTVFALLMSITDLYQRIRYEYQWRTFRSEGALKTTRLPMIGALGLVRDNLPYQSEPVLRVESEAQGAVKISQIVWKFKPVKGSEPALVPEMTQMTFTDFPTALRGKEHALESQEQDYAALGDHDFILRGVKDTLDWYVKSREPLSEEIRDQLIATLTSVQTGPNGRFGLGKRRARHYTPGLRRVAANVLPKPGPKVALAIANIQTGTVEKLKEAADSIETAQLWTRARRQYIEKITAPATQRKRDYAYALMRDTLIRDALIAIKTNVTGPVSAGQPIDLIKTRSAEQSLRGLEQTYFRFIASGGTVEPEIILYKNLQHELRGILSLLSALTQDLSRSALPKTAKPTAEKLNQKIQGVLADLQSAQVRRARNLRSEMRSAEAVSRDAAELAQQIAQLQQDLRAALEFMSSQEKDAALPSVGADEFGIFAGTPIAQPDDAGQGRLLAQVDSFLERQKLVSFLAEQYEAQPGRDSGQVQEFSASLQVIESQIRHLEEHLGRSEVRSLQSGVLAVQFPEGGLKGQPPISAPGFLLDFGEASLSINTWPQRNSALFSPKEEEIFISGKGLTDPDTLDLKPDQIREIRHSIYDRRSGVIRVRAAIETTAGQKIYVIFGGSTTSSLSKLKNLLPPMAALRDEETLAQISLGNQGDLEGNFTVKSQDGSWNLFAATDDSVIGKTYRALVEFADSTRKPGRVRISGDPKTGQITSVFFTPADGFAPEFLLDPKDAKFVLSAYALGWGTEPAQKLLREQYTVTSDFRHVFSLPFFGGQFVFYDQLLVAENKLQAAFEWRAVDFKLDPKYQNPEFFKVFKTYGYNEKPSAGEVTSPGDYFIAGDQIHMIFQPAAYPLNALLVSQDGRHTAALSIPGASGRVGADYWRIFEWTKNEVQRQLGWEPFALFALDNGMDPNWSVRSSDGSFNTIVSGGRDGFNATLLIKNRPLPARSEMRFRSSMEQAIELLKDYGKQKEKLIHSVLLGDRAGYITARATMASILQRFQTAVEASPAAVTRAVTRANNEISKLHVNVAEILLGVPKQTPPALEAKLLSLAREIVSWLPASTDLNKRREALAQHLKAVTNPFSFAGMLPEEPVDFGPQAAIQLMMFLGQFEMENKMPSLAMAQQWGHDLRVGVRAEAAATEELFEAAVLHEFSHALSFLGELPVSPGNEVLTHAITALRLAHKAGVAGVAQSGPQLYEAFVLGEQLARDGLLPDPETDPQGFIRQFFLKVGDAMRPPNAEFLERLTGSAAAGWIWHHFEAEGSNEAKAQKAYPYLMALVVKADPSLKIEHLAPADRRRIQDRLGLVEQVLHSYTGDHSIRAEVNDRSRLWYYDPAQAKAYVPIEPLFHPNEAITRGAAYSFLAQNFYVDRTGIEEPLKNNPWFVMLFTMLRLPEARKTMIEDLKISEAQRLMQDYIKYQFSDPVEFGGVILSKQPAHVQLLEAIYYFVHYQKRDPRIQNETVAAALSEIDWPVQQAMGKTDDREFYEFVKTKVWPILEALLKEEAAKLAKSSGLDDDQLAEQLAAESGLGMDQMTDSGSGSAAGGMMPPGMGGSPMPGRSGGKGRPGSGRPGPSQPGKTGQPGQPGSGSSQRPAPAAPAKAAKPSAAKPADGKNAGQEAAAAKAAADKAKADTQAAKTKDPGEKEIEDLVSQWDRVNPAFDPLNPSGSAGRKKQYGKPDATMIAMAELHKVTPAQLQWYTHEIMPDVQSQIEVLRRDFDDLFPPSQDPRWEGGQPMGSDIDENSIDLLLAGDANVMRVRAGEPERPDVYIKVLVDETGSMARENKKLHAQQALALLLEAISTRDQIHVGVTGYSSGGMAAIRRAAGGRSYEHSYARPHLPMTEGSQLTKREIIGAVSQVVAEGGNERDLDALVDTLGEMRELPQNSHRHVFVITDGDPERQFDRTAYQQEVLRAKREGITVWMVWIGSQGEALARELVPPAQAMGGPAKRLGSVVGETLRRVARLVLASESSDQGARSEVRVEDGMAIPSVVGLQKLSSPIYIQTDEQGGHEAVVLFGDRFPIKKDPDLAHIPPDKFYVSNSNLQKSHEIMKVLRDARRPIMLHGHHGTGKDFLARSIASLLGRSARMMTFHENMHKEDLFFRRGLDAEEKSLKDEYSDLVLAAINGQGIILDEYNKLKTPVRLQLLNALDTAFRTKKINLPSGEVIDVKEGFFVIATLNEGVGYQVERLDPAESDRFDWIKVNFLPPREEYARIQSFISKGQFKGSGRFAKKPQLLEAIYDALESLTEVAVQLRADYEKSEGQLVPRPLSTRVLERIAIHLNAYPEDVYRMGTLLNRHYNNDFAPDHVKQYIRGILSSRSALTDEPMKLTKVDFEKADLKYEGSGAARFLVLGNARVRVATDTPAAQTVQRIIEKTGMTLGEEDLLRLWWIMKDMSLGFHVALVGYKGTGKTVTAEFLGELLHGERGYTTIPFDEETEPYHYIVRRSYKQGKLMFEELALPKAIRGNKLTILEEFNNARPKSRAAMNEVFARNELNLPGLDPIRARRGEGFVMLALMNPPGKGYKRHQTPSELWDRVTVETFHYPHRQEEIRKVNEVLIHVEARDMARELVSFSEVLRTHLDQGAIGDAPSLRFSQAWARHLQQHPEDRDALPDLVDRYFHLEKPGEIQLRSQTLRQVGLHRHFLSPNEEREVLGQVVPGMPLEVLDLFIHFFTRIRSRYKAMSNQLMKPPLHPSHYLLRDLLMELSSQMPPEEWLKDKRKLELAVMDFFRFRYTQAAISEVWLTEHIDGGVLLDPESLKIKDDYEFVFFGPKEKARVAAAASAAGGRQPGTPAPRGAGAKRSAAPSREEALRDFAADAAELDGVTSADLREEILKMEGRVEEAAAAASSGIFPTVPEDEPDVVTDFADFMAGDDAAESPIVVLPDDEVEETTAAETLAAGSSGLILHGDFRPAPVKPIPVGVDTRFDPEKTANLRSSTVTAGGPIASYALHPVSSNLVLVGLENGQIEIWDLATKNLVTRVDVTDSLMDIDEEMAATLFLGGKVTITALAVSPTGAEMAMAFDTHVLVLNLNKLLAQGAKADLKPALLNHTNYPNYPVTALAFNPEGTRLAVASGHTSSGGRPGTAVINVLQIGSVIKSIIPFKYPLMATGAVTHTDLVNAIAWSPKGDYLVSGSRDGSVQLWHAKTRSPVGPAVKVHRGAVNSVAWGLTGGMFASGGDDYKIVFYSPVKKRGNGTLVAVKASEEVPTGVPVAVVDFHPSGKTLGFIGKGGRAGLIERHKQEGILVHTIYTDPHEFSGGGFSQDERTLVAVGKKINTPEISAFDVTQAVRTEKKPAPSSSGDAPAATDPVVRSEVRSGFTMNRKLDEGLRIDGDIQIVVKGIDRNTVVLAIKAPERKFLKNDLFPADAEGWRRVVLSNGQGLIFRQGAEDIGVIYERIPGNSAKVKLVIDAASSIKVDREEVYTKAGYEAALLLQEAASELEDVRVFTAQIPHAFDQSQQALYYLTGVSTQEMKVEAFGGAKSWDKDTPIAKAAQIRVRVSQSPSPMTDEALSIVLWSQVEPAVDNLLKNLAGKKAVAPKLALQRLKRILERGNDADKNLALEINRALASQQSTLTAESLDPQTVLPALKVLIHYAALQSGGRLVLSRSLDEELRIGPDTVVSYLASSSTQRVAVLEIRSPNESPQVVFLDEGGSVELNPGVFVFIDEAKDTNARLGVVAPKDVFVMREEIYQAGLELIQTKAEAPHFVYQVKAGAPYIPLTRYISVIQYNENQKNRNYSIKINSQLIHPEEILKRQIAAGDIIDITFQARSEVRAPIEDFTAAELTALPEELQRALAIYKALLLLKYKIDAKPQVPPDTELAPKRANDQVKELALAAGEMIKYELIHGGLTQAEISRDARALLLRAAEVYAAEIDAKTKRKAKTLQDLARNVHILVALLAKKYGTEKEAADSTAGIEDVYALQPTPSAAPSRPRADAGDEVRPRAGKTRALSDQPVAEKKKKTLKKAAQISPLRRWVVRPLLALWRMVRWAWYQFTQQPWKTLILLGAIAVAGYYGYYAYMHEIFGEGWQTQAEPILTGFATIFYFLAFILAGAGWAFIRINVWDNFSMPGGARSKWEPGPHGPDDVPESTHRKMADEERRRTEAELNGDEDEDITRSEVRSQKDDRKKQQKKKAREENNRRKLLREREKRRTSLTVVPGAAREAEQLARQLEDAMRGLLLSGAQVSLLQGDATPVERPRGNADNLARISHFNIFPAEEAAALTADLDLLERAPLAFEGWEPPKQWRAYNMAVLLGREALFPEDSARDPEIFSFDPGSGVSTSEDLNSLYSRGYFVPPEAQWTRLNEDVLREVLQGRGSPVRTSGANVLNLAGGHGKFLRQLSAFFDHSKLVLLEANAHNVLTAFSVLPNFDDRENNFEIKLADARRGFDGIPYPDDTFDFLTMEGDSEFGMSADDLARVLAEAMRVLKKDNGSFLIETTHINRYAEILQLLSDQGFIRGSFAVLPMTFPNTYLLVTGTELVRRFVPQAAAHSEVRKVPASSAATRIQAAEFLDGLFLPDDLAEWTRLGKIPAGALPYLEAPRLRGDLEAVLAEAAELFSAARPSAGEWLSRFPGETLKEQDKKAYLIGPELIRRYGPVLIALEQSAPAASRLIALAKDETEALQLEKLVRPINKRLPKHRQVMIKTPQQARVLLKADTLRGLGLGELDAALLRRIIPDFLPLNVFELDAWVSQVPGLAALVQRFQALSSLAAAA